MFITHCSLLTVSTCFHVLKIIIRESFNLVHTFIQNGYDTDSTVAQLVWVNILAEMSLTTLCIEGWGLGAGVPQPLHLDQACILMRGQNSCIILYYLEFDFPINPITLLGISSPGDFDVFQKQHLTYNHTTIRLRRYAGTPSRVFSENVCILPSQKEFWKNKLCLIREWGFLSVVLQNTVLWSSGEFQNCMNLICLCYSGLPENIFLPASPRWAS